MKVLALTRYQHLGASSRVRFFQYYAYFANRNIQITTNSLLSDCYVNNLYVKKRKDLAEMVKGYLCRLWVLLSVWRYDVVWVEKELFPGLPSWFEGLLKILKIRMVIDYDDAIFHNYDYLASKFVKFLMGGKIAKVMRSADTVIAGNAYIANYAKRNGCKSVVIIPSVVDASKYYPRSQTSNLIPVVGWIGTPSTIRYVRSISPALVAVQQKYPFILRIVGATFECPGLNVECIQWSEQSEVRSIQSFDIGIMPLDDTPWEQGKCGYKLIQYMACGVPIIGSPVGVNSLIITESVGFIARTHEEWEQSLVKLLTDPELRIAKGRCARDSANVNYNSQITVHDLIAIFEKS